MPATTPDTTAYLLLALGVFFGIVALFIVSMVVRASNLHKDERTIEQLGEEN
jgi:phosphotransferase system  glucose/maltose/N-acetylglucosamine-specific IIC component